MEVTQFNKKAWQTFAKIHSFIGELKNALENFVELDDTFHEIILYDYLLSKVTQESRKAIVKNNAIFTKFCVSNEKAILSRDSGLLQDTRITYSEKIFIDFLKVFKVVNSSCANAVWDHIWVIAAYVCPHFNTKELLKDRVEHREENFVKGLIGKISISEDDPKDPMLAVMQMVSSGEINKLSTEVREGIQDGDLKLDKLIDSVKKE